MHSSTVARMMVFILMCSGDAWCRELPDPATQPGYYSNKWIVITSTNADSSAVVCTEGRMIRTDSYDGLKGGLYVCVNSCLPTQAEAVSESDQLKKKGIDNYIRKCGALKGLVSAEGSRQESSNPLFDSATFNSFIGFSRAKVLGKPSGQGRYISGDYFGLAKTKRIFLSDSIIDETIDTVSKGDYRCGFFCPPEYRNVIKDRENLYCVIPTSPSRLLLIYFAENWLIKPFNDSTYYRIQECNGNAPCTTYTTYVQGGASEIPGPIRMHELGNGYLLLERVSYRQQCDGELVLFTVFDKELHHVGTIDEMSTFSQPYLSGPRPIKKQNVPDGVLAGMNESMCYIVDSFYAADYNGTHAILRYDDFKLSEAYLWNGSSFINKRKQ